MRKRYLLAVLVILLGSLSAKPVLAQFPLEVGFGVDASVALMQSRAYGFPDRADNKGAVSVEGAYGYSMYLSTFPYEGWGWRAEVSGGVRGQPGSYLADEPGRVSHLYGRARAELLYVTPGWTIVGFGASLTRTGTSYLDYGGTGSYWTLGDRSAFGAHVAWSQLARW